MGGNGYNHQSFHQRNSSFLPILCSRPSIKDVQLPRWRHHRSASFSDDPSSPRVSCIGQVKRTNRVIAFPTPCRFTAAKPAPATNLKYHKLRRLFSGKGLAAPPSINHSSGKNATANSARRVKLNDSHNNYNTSDGGDRVDYAAAAAAEVNIAELDPPLPVVKRAADGRREEVNLWKRRSGGVALKVQLQPVHHTSNNPHCLVQPTTV
ncbi:uncharacterized protein LOC127808175 [Diospyros lotus]|uniref:uncharacterized protein LOC127808175 n=1 Tax=Diospyros lotus TaxID=55363 RepID=UPI0022568247|nr:uncharacterized protein LOC127808175 [Diospyros lotus]